MTHQHIARAPLHDLPIPLAVTIAVLRCLMMLEKMSRCLLQGCSPKFFKNPAGGIRDRRRRFLLRREFVGSPPTGPETVEQGISKALGHAVNSLGCRSFNVARCLPSAARRLSRCSSLSSTSARALLQCGSDALKDQAV